MSVTLFLCYAREDKALLDTLKIHLMPLQQRKLIESWYEREVSEDWKPEFNSQLDKSQVVVILVSPDLINSRYEYSFDLNHALGKHERGESILIPVILRQVYWQRTPFGKIQALPKNVPSVIGSWYSTDEAFSNVAEGILSIVEKQAHKIAEEEQMLKEKQEEALETNEIGNKLFDEKHYWEALLAYEQAASLNPQLVVAYNNKGTTLYMLGRWQEALAVYQEALRLDPDCIMIHINKGATLEKLRRYQEAKEARQRAWELAWDIASLRFSHQLPSVQKKC